MPEFGFWELALIMLVALLIVGPQRLPRLAADAGAWIGRIKKIAQRFKADLAYELNASELEKTIGKPRQEIDRMQKEVQTTAEQVSNTIRALDPLHDTMREQISNSGRYQGDDESLSQAAGKPQTPNEIATLDSSVTGTTQDGKPQTPGEGITPVANKRSARYQTNNESLSQAAGKPQTPTESTASETNNRSARHHGNNEILSQATGKSQTSTESTTLDSSVTDTTRVGKLHTSGESTTPVANKRSARYQANDEGLSQAAGKPQAPNESTTPATNNRNGRRHQTNNESLSQAAGEPQAPGESTTLDSSVADTTRAGKPQTPNESTTPETNNRIGRRYQTNNESLSQSAGKPHTSDEGAALDSSVADTTRAGKSQASTESTMPATNKRSGHYQGNNESLSQAAAGKPQTTGESTMPATNNHSARYHDDDESLSQATGKSQTSTESTIPTTTNRDPNDKP